MWNPSGEPGRPRASRFACRGVPCPRTWHTASLFVLLLLTTIVTLGFPAGPPVATAQEDGTPRVEGTPLAGTPVPETGAGPEGTLARGFGGTTVTPAEQELADKYAPVAMRKKQLKPCDPSGEQYVPIAVDVSLNDPEVKLRREAKDGKRKIPSSWRGLRRRTW